MKKILAGVLAVASMLSVSVAASATSTKAISKTGDVTYDVAVAPEKVVLNLVMPAKMAAALNPYGAEIKLSTAEGEVSTAGIASTAYKVENKSKDYGVYLDATAVTTVSTSDKNAEGKPAWGVVPVASIADGTKNAALTLMGGENAEDFKDATSGANKGPVAPIDSKAATNNTKADQGALALDSTKPADPEKKIAAGTTTQKKFLYVPAEGAAHMAFIGKLAKDSTGENAAEVVWNEDDAINVSLVLKVVVGPKTLA